MEIKPILIVDDEKNIRLTLSQALESLDFEVQAAVNGEEALSMLAETSYGLILLDLKMPGMDGMEVLRRIRETRPEIKVIIISAHGTIDLATEAMKLGAVDFIQKPFAPKEIRELVTDVLERDSIDEKTAGTYKERIELAKRSISEQQFDSAQEHVRQAISIDSTKPEALNLLGAIKEMRGDWLDALKQYRAALALDPTYKPANKNVERIVIEHKQGNGINLGEDEGPAKANK
jgi:DNA-binding NtrC family response regulator